MKYFLILIAILLLFYILIYKNFVNQNDSQKTLKINNILIYVRLARTQEEISKGLGGVTSLGEKEGMLFLFTKKDYYAFWMKDMKIPLDMIWISDDKIVTISKNVPVSSNNQLTIYRPEKAVNYVLEVNSGFSDKYKITVGDTVEGINRLINK